MICHHVLCLAIDLKPHREQGKKTIVQSLFPFHGKLDFSTSQTAFEHLTWPNQTSLHHVAVTQPSDAEKREQSLPWGHIQRSKLPSWLHRLRSLCRDEWHWNENVPLWGERKRGDSLPLVVLWGHQLDQTVFACKPNVIPGKLWHPPWRDQALSAW